MPERLTINSNALPASATVVGFRGVEAISRLYELDVYLLLDDEHADFEPVDALGEPVTLEIARGERPDRIHGRFSMFEFVAVMDEQVLFKAVLVPQLWQLTQSLHSRIFTDQSVPDIIQSVLEQSGLTSQSYELKLAGNHAVHDHVCQYRESDFDFISRWMEREGLYYFFEQGESREKLVITDHKSFHERRDETVRFFESSSRDFSARGEALRAFTSRHHALPARVALHDYDYQRPALAVMGDAPVSEGAGQVTVHSAGFTTPEAGREAAKLRAEELQARQQVFRGSGTVSGLHAGQVFSLDEHPRTRLNASYLLVEVETSVNQLGSNGELARLTGLEQDEVFHVHVVAIPSAVQFRARSTTSWPRVYGFEAGTVSGPETSPYAQIDDAGRYKVKLMFDESALAGARTSMWVRMMQPHGGGVEGWHFPLRKGTEVILTFLGGDPDRPVIAGVVPNAHTPSPVGQHNHTENVIVTGGGNSIVIEDRAAAQSITEFTPYDNTKIRLGAPETGDDHNLVLRTDGKGFSHTGDDWDITIDKKLNETVVGDVTENYCATFTQTIGSEDDQTVDGVDAAKTLDTDVVTQDIYGNVTQTVEGDVTQSVSGEVAQSVEKSLTQTINGHVTQTFNAEEGAALSESEEFSWYQKVYGSVHQEATDEWIIQAKKAEMISTDYAKASYGNHAEFIGGSKSETVGGFKNDNVLGLSIGTLVGGKLEVAIGIAVELALSANFKYAILEGSKTSIELHSAEAKMERSLMRLENRVVSLEDNDVSIEDKMMDIEQAVLHLLD